MLYELNAHGDVVAITDGISENANMVYEYDAFGNQRYISTLDDNPFRYCGQYYDNETGNYYLRARYYTPAVGRFTQQDQHWNVNNMIYGDKEADEGSGASSCLVSDCKENPIIFKNIKNNLEYYNYFIPKNNLKEQTVKLPDYSAISQSCNLYTYCSNNSLKYSDSNGESVTLVAIGICIAISGATLILTGCTNDNNYEYKSDFNSATGYYGTPGSSSHVRHLSGGLSAASAFFYEHTADYVTETNSGYAIVRTMDDGTVYTFRETSRDGTPVIDINSNMIGVKSQKIHFID